MRSLLYPAIALMNRLEYGKKNLLLFLLSLLAVLIVVFSFYRNFKPVIAKAHIELAGLEQLKQTTKLVNRLQQLRAVSLAVKGGVDPLKSRKMQLAQEIDQVLSQLPGSVPQPQLEHLGFASILDAWSNIKQSQLSANADLEFGNYTRLIESTLIFHEKLGTEAFLMVSTEQDSYLLSQLIVQELPQHLENIAQMRGISIEALTQKSLSDEQRFELLALKHEIERRTSRIAFILERTSQFNPTLKESLHYINDSLDSTLRMFNQTVLPDILQGTFSTDPEYFVSSLLLLVDANYQIVFETLFPETHLQIQGRLAAAEKLLLINVSVPLLLFGLVAYLALGMSWSISGSIMSLLRVMQAFSRGQHQQRLSIASCDELGRIGVSFNDMADSFEALLKNYQQDKKRLVNILDTALDAVVQMNAEGILCGWNHQAEVIFGWKAEEVIGRPLHEVIIPPQFRDAHQKGLQRYMLSGDAQSINRRIEIVGLHRDGHEIPIELAITPNELMGSMEFSAFIRDITNQKRSISILQENERRYRLLFESSRDAILILNADNGFVSCNSAAIKLFGCNNEAELLNHNPVSLSPAFQPNGFLSSDECQNKLQQTYENGFVEFEWLHQRLDGQKFTADVVLTRIDLEHESLIQANVRDISERKKDKAELVASEARFRGILRTMTDAVLQIDAYGCILLVNDAALELFGYEEEELLGRNINVLMPEPHHSLHDEYLANHRQHHTRVILGRRVEVDGKCKDGSLIPIELSVNELMADSGYSYIGVIRDIGARKKTEQALENARLEALKLVQVKSEFLANMSHEIRTPLNAIIGLAKISLREQSGKKDPTLHLQRIYDAGKHLLNVVNDILDFSKMEAGKLLLENNPFRLTALIDDAVNLNELRIREKNLQWMVDKSKDLPEWVMGDSLRIRQILVNLLSNAIKFTEQGYVSLTVRREQDNILFTVSDSGIGISPEQLSRLFNAFEQADGSTTRRFGGSGLGLVISRDLAKLMGGDITVRSQLGSGSQFCLNIPLPETAPIQEQSQSFDSSGQRLNGVRVLAADDVELNRLVLDDMLVQEGAQVVFAENGQQVLQRLQELGASAIDVVLMDIQMPVMDGYRATQKLLELAPDLPVIGLTAHAMPEERARCLEVGMRERVTKPIDVDQLVAIILKNLPNKPDSPPIEQVAPEPAVEKHLPMPADPVADPDTSERLIDWPTILQRFEGRQAFVDRLIESALDGTQHSNVEKLRLALQQQDYSTIKFVAHNIKGFAGVFQVTVLSELAQAIEQAMKNQDDAGLQRVDEFADCLLRVLGELQQYKESKHHNES